MSDASVGYLTFGRDALGSGMARVVNDCVGRPVHRVTAKTAKLVDWLAYSLFWWEHLYVLADHLRQARIRKADKVRPRIVVGGFNAFNPRPLISYADFVCVGDGEGVVPALIAGDKPGCVWDGSAVGVDYGVAPLTPFCHETNGIARIEIARGCRYRCAFCAVAHLKPYREITAEQVGTLLAQTKCRRVALFAPEPSLHSQAEAIDAQVRRYGKTRLDKDARLDRVAARAERNPDTYIIGLEGLSERLRRSVNKPYSDDMVVETVRRLMAAGCNGVRFYVILDLPGETDADWDAFFALMNRIDDLPGIENFMLKVLANTFVPAPGTPLECEPMHVDRDYRAKWTEFWGRKPTWRAKLAVRGRSNRVFSQASRLLQAVATRAAEEFADIESALWRNRVIDYHRVTNCGGVDGVERVKAIGFNALARALRPFGGVERYCGPVTADARPWSMVRFPQGVVANA